MIWGDTTEITLVWVANTGCSWLRGSLFLLLDHSLLRRCLQFCGLATGLIVFTTTACFTVFMHITVTYNFCGCVCTFIYGILISAAITDITNEWMIRRLVNNYWKGCRMKQSWSNMSYFFEGERKNKENLHQGSGSNWSLPKWEWEVLPSEPTYSTVFVQSQYKHLSCFQTMAPKSTPFLEVCKKLISSVITFSSYFYTTWNCPNSAHFCTEDAGSYAHSCQMVGMALHHRHTNTDEVKFQEYKCY